MFTFDFFCYQALPAAATAVWAALLCALLARYFVKPLKYPVAKRKNKPGIGARQALLYVTAAFVVSRAALLLIALGSAAATNCLDRFTADPLSYLVRWDANHYIGLAENWYVNEGDARLHLVFFPLYPMIVRGLYLLGLDATAAAFTVSNAALFGCGMTLFRLVETDQGADGARRATRLLMFAPMTIFFSLPYSESVFLLTTLLSVLAARKRRFFWAIVFGALASFARLLGLLCAVPVFYEYLLAAREKKGGARAIAAGFGKTCLIAVGFAAYLCLNERVAGDPLRFLTYQREHWSQAFGSLYNTLSYTLRNAFCYDDFALRLGTWMPQAAFILLTLTVLALCARTVNPGDGAYMLLYLYIAAAPTWLLSGARYLTALYALYPALALLTRAKWQSALATALSLAGMVWFSYLYLFSGSVM